MQAVGCQPWSPSTIHLKLALYAAVTVTPPFPRIGNVNAILQAITILKRSSLEYHLYDGYLIAGQIFRSGLLSIYNTQSGSSPSPYHFQRMATPTGTRLHDKIAIVTGAASEITLSPNIMTEPIQEVAPGTVKE
jgi:hypothetical protein